MKKMMAAVAVAAVAPFVFAGPAAAASWQTVYNGTSVATCRLVQDSYDINFPWATRIVDWTGGCRVQVYR